MFSYVSSLLNTEEIERGTIPHRWHFCHNADMTKYFKHLCHQVLPEQMESGLTFWWVDQKFSMGILNCRKDLGIVACSYLENTNNWFCFNSCIYRKERKSLRRMVRSFILCWIAICICLPKRRNPNYRRSVSGSRINTTSCSKS